VYDGDQKNNEDNNVKVKLIDFSNIQKQKSFEKEYYKYSNQDKIENKKIESFKNQRKNSVNSKNKLNDTKKSNFISKIFLKNDKEIIKNEEEEVKQKDEHYINSLKSLIDILESVVNNDNKNDNDNVKNENVNCNDLQQYLDLVSKNILENIKTKNDEKQNKEENKKFKVKIFLKKVIFIRFGGINKRIYNSLSR
jgi:hypothetical protein